MKSDIRQGIYSSVFTASMLNTGNFMEGYCNRSIFMIMDNLDSYTVYDEVCNSVNSVVSRSITLSVSNSIHAFLQAKE